MNEPRVYYGKIWVMIRVIVLWLWVRGKAFFPVAYHLSPLLCASSLTCFGKHSTFFPKKDQGDGMGNFLEIIEWFDDTGKEIAHRVPEEGSGDIKYGAQLTVRESQAAIFFYEGKAYDAVGAGRYTLSTLNIPIITKLLSLPWGFTSPLRAEVYFVNTKTFTNLAWGTKRSRRLQGFRTRSYQAPRLRYVKHQGYPAVAVHQYPCGNKGLLNRQRTSGLPGKSRTLPFQ